MGESKCAQIKTIFCFVCIPSKPGLGRIVYICLCVSIHLRACKLAIVSYIIRKWYKFKSGITIYFWLNSTISLSLVFHSFGMCVQTASCLLAAICSFDSLSFPFYRFDDSENVFVIGNFYVISISSLSPHFVFFCFGYVSAAAAATHCVNLFCYLYTICVWCDLDYFVILFVYFFFLHVYGNTINKRPRQKHYTFLFAGNMLYYFSIIRAWISVALLSFLRKRERRGKKN